jgi:hypothetical protein
LLPGFYLVRVTAKGFKALQQDNLMVNAMGTLGFNPAGVGVFDYRDNRSQHCTRYLRLKLRLNARTRCQFQARSTILVGIDLRCSQHRALRHTPQRRATALSGCFAAFAVTAAGVPP